jgi:hypothetical protein
MLGFGDACFNTQVFLIGRLNYEDLELFLVIKILLQIFSMLGSVFSNDSASAFAIFKFVQSLSAAIAFFYSNLLSLYFQVFKKTYFVVVIDSHYQ